MVSTETIVAGVGAVAVLATIAWIAMRGDDTDGDAITGTDTSSDAATDGTAQQLNRSAGSGSRQSQPSADSPSSSASGRGAEASPSRASGTKSTSDSGAGGASGTSSPGDGTSDTDDGTVTRLYDPTADSQQDPQVWLHIEGERIEIPDGTAIGRELRRHLVEQGVSERRALAVSRDHFMISTTGDGVRLRDLDSTGGTVLDGSRLTPEQWVPLDDGDEIVLAGQLRGHFEIN